MWIMALAFTFEIFIKVSLLPSSPYRKGLENTGFLALHGAELGMDNLLYRTSLFPLLKLWSTVVYFLLFKILSSPDFWNSTFFWLTFYLVYLSRSFLILPLHFPEICPGISLLISSNLLTLNDICVLMTPKCISSSGTKTHNSCTPVPSSLPTCSASGQTKLLITPQEKLSVSLPLPNK